MKPLPAPKVPGKTEYERFDNALRKVLSVHKPEAPKPSFLDRQILDAQHHQSSKPFCKSSIQKEQQMNAAKHSPAVGDTVYLKSGSPALTVKELSGEMLTVEWQADNGVNHMTSPAACFTLNPKFH